MHHYHVYSHRPLALYTLRQRLMTLRERPLVTTHLARKAVPQHRSVRESRRYTAVKAPFGYDSYTESDLWLRQLH